MTLFLENVNIKSQDSTSIDAFGRWRTSEPESIFDSKQIFDNQPLFWDELLETGSGISAAHSTDTASTVLTSTINTAGKFTRQTFMRFNYQPGKSQQIMLTGILERSGGGTGVDRRLGLFDDDNGLFFQSNAGTINVVRRTNVTGSPVDTPIEQSNWNGDVLDGSGGTSNPSGATADWSKTQIFIIDYEWLGTGRVRFCLAIDGQVILLHEIRNANVLDKVYMSTPNLPVRFQMITTGSSPASTMEQICAAIVSEGGAEDLGILRYKSTEGTHIDCNVEDTIYAIVGIRLKSTHIGSDIKIQRIAIQIQTATDTGEWIWMLNPTVADTFAYSGEDDSSIETATGNILNTVTDGTQITGGFAEAQGAGVGSGGVTSPIPNALRLGASINGTVDTMVLCWRPNGGTSNHDVEGSVTWREVS